MNASRAVLAGSLRSVTFNHVTRYAGRYPAKPKVTNFAMNNIRSFAIVATLIAFGALFCIISIGNAEREYESYEKLCSLGATGDDWVSFREFITGRPPIVQLDLPPTIPVDVAMELVTDLHNLESLTVSFDSLTESQLSTIRNLKLNAIHFNGEFPSDAEIDRLAAFSDVRFLYLPANQVSPDSMRRLQSMLPNASVTLN